MPQPRARRWALPVPRLRRLLFALLGAAAVAPALLPLRAMSLVATAHSGDGLPWETVAKIFLAGGTGCCLSHATATPLDVIKTRQQFDPERYTHSGTGEALGVLAVGKRIAQEEGPAMLLQGLGSTCLGYLLQGAVKYGLWETFLASMGYGTAAGITKVWILVLAAFSADMIASVVLCPFERARIRLVSDPEYARGPLKAMAQMVQDEGVIAGLYGEGLAATLIKQQAYTVSKLTTFTLVWETLERSFGAPRSMLVFASSMLAGLTASIASQPGDTLQVCTGSSSSLREECPVSEDMEGPPGILELARRIGIRKLFTGWQARLLQVEFIVVTQLVTYDCVKSMVGL